MSTAQTIIAWALGIALFLISPPPSNISIAYILASPHDTAEQP